MPVRRIQHMMQCFIWAKPKYLFCHGLERYVASLTRPRRVQLIYFIEVSMHTNGTVFGQGFACTVLYDPI
jgi:hypothetical protein